MSEHAPESGTYLGRFRGAHVWAQVEDGERNIRTLGMDFAFPIDLNGTFENWVERRDPWIEVGWADVSDNTGTHHARTTYRLREATR